MSTHSMRASGDTVNLAAITALAELRAERRVNARERASLILIAIRAHRTNHVALDLK